MYIHKHPANQTEYFRNWTTSGNIYSFWFMTSIICLRNISQWAALTIYIWVPRVMTHFTAAKNWKSLLTVTQFGHCIFERIIKGKTSFLKKINGFSVKWYVKEIIVIFVSEVKQKYMVTHMFAIFFDTVEVANYVRAGHPNFGAIQILVQSFHLAVCHSMGNFV